MRKNNFLSESEWKRTSCYKIIANDNKRKSNGKQNRDSLKNQLKNNGKNMICVSHLSLGSIELFNKTTCLEVNTKGKTEILKS